MDGLASNRFTRLSKTISALLFAGCCVALFAPSTTQYLTLVPGRTLPCVWNLLTAGFITTNPIKVLIEILAVLLMSRLIEPVYGSKEFLKYLVVVELLTSTCTFVAVYVMYAATMSPALLYTQFSGFHGLLGALLVAVKQIMPDHELKLLGFLHLKTKYVPSLFVLLAASLAFALKATSQLPFLLLGTYFGWLYLRFFQQQPETTIKGDPSEDFKFSTFFPELMHPPIDLLGAVLSKVFRLQHSAALAAAEGKAAAATALLGSDSMEANRRRERGAKALEERLSKKAPADVEQGGEDGAA